jgi:hypothetical protein
LGFDGDAMWSTRFKMGADLPLHACKGPGLLHLPRQTGSERGGSGYGCELWIRTGEIEQVYINLSITSEDGETVVVDFDIKYKKRLF